jgi:microcystin-dependent protein
MALVRMASPSQFNRQNSFALFSSENPGQPHSGVTLDQEFNAVKISLDQTQNALADVRESDGSLKRGSVGTAQLAGDIAIGVTARGVWSTGINYVGGIDVVFHTTKLYRATGDHTSGIFATDMAAGKWTEIADLGVQVLDLNSVDTQHLVDGSGTTAKHANSSVTTPKIATAAVTTPKIADANVTEAKLDATLVSKIAMAGEIKIWPGITAPTGWFFCYGQSLLRASYPALFSAIGTTYGAADGTHFNVPDLRGRVVAGKDDMGGTSAFRLTVVGGTLGSSGGVETRTLVTENLPPYTPAGSVAITDPGHQHPGINPYKAGGSAAGGQISPVSGAGGGSVPIESATTGITAAFTGTAQGGTSTAFGVVQPTIILNFIIKAH